MAISPTCPRCGAFLRPDERDCARCLLDAAGAGNEEERIFQAALQHGPDRREAFVQQATQGDPELRKAVEMLLAGHAEAGGDPDDAGPVYGDFSGADTASAAEEPGLQIGHFRLIRRVGEGGMGTVWQAEQSAPSTRDSSTWRGSPGTHACPPCSCNPPARPPHASGTWNGKNRGSPANDPGLYRPPGIPRGSASR